MQGALFLNQCLVDDPDHRMSVKDMVSHPYLQQSGLEEIQGEKVCEDQNAAELAKFKISPESWIRKNESKGLVYRLNSKTPEQNGEKLASACIPESGE